MKLFDTPMNWADLARMAPDVVAALRALGKAVDDAGLEKPLTELLKIRASQLNGCAFCLQFHLNEARQAGVSPAKIDLVATWGEAGIFSDRERAALAWTDALTLLKPSAELHSIHQAVNAHFSAQEGVYLTASIGAINAWNRIAGGLRLTPPIPAERLNPLEASHVAS